MNIYWIIVVVFAAVAVPYACRVLKRKVINSVYADLEKGDYGKCFETMNKAWCKIALSGFEYILLRLDVSMTMGSAKEVDLCMDKLDSAYMNKGRREQILYMAMTYYVENGNKEKCEWVLDQLKSINSDTAYGEAEKLYHVFVMKDGKYIKEMEQAFDETEDNEGKLALASFLVMQYENTGDIKASDKYKKIVKELKENQTDIDK